MAREVKGAKIPTDCKECCAMTMKRVGGGHGEGSWEDIYCTLLGTRLGFYGEIEEKRTANCPFKSDGPYSLIRADNTHKYDWD